jgi:hypothetical protein
MVQRSMDRVARLTDDRLLGIQRILALIVGVEGQTAMHVLVIMKFGIVN